MTLSPSHFHAESCTKRAVPETGIGWSTSTNPGLDYIEGTVLATARKVVVKTLNGETLQTPVIRPAPAFDPNVGFFVARLRCGAVVSAVALSQSGRVVAKRNLPATHQSC
jgi:hypothetical protein